MSKLKCHIVGCFATGLICAGMTHKAEVFLPAVVVYVATACAFEYLLRKL